MKTQVVVRQYEGHRYDPQTGLLMEKRCSHCRKWKPIRPVPAFHSNRAVRAGYASICKPCNAKHTRAWAERNRPRVRAYMQGWKAAQKKKLGPKGIARLNHKLYLLRVARHGGVEGYNAFIRAQYQRYRDAWTPEQIAHKKASKKAWYRALTHRQRSAKRAQHREWRRRWWKAMTEAQKAAYRLRMNARKRALYKKKKAARRP